MHLYVLFLKHPGYSFFFNIGEFRHYVPHILNVKSTKIHCLISLAKKVLSCSASVLKSCKATNHRDLNGPMVWLHLSI